MFEITNLHKIYDGGEKETVVLRGANFSCRAGEFVGVFGASGSGKSTFLHIIGGLDNPSSGEIKFEGRDLCRMREKELADFRNKTIGFIFQFYHLLPEFSAIENVMLPCLIAGRSKGDAKKLAVEALQNVEMSDRMLHRPAHLSGGEQQRVAIARAIVMQPKFILADEPTGNLDEENGFKVFSYLEKLNKETGMGIIMVTHNPDLLQRIPRKLELKNGKLHE